jgi:preprotein translocase subunit SecG
MQELIETPLTWLHIMACLFLVLVVLIQPGKSGGMGALSGAAATQVFGGRGAGNVLTKTTWITASIFFFTSLTLAYFSSSATDSLESKAPTVKSAPPTEPAKK